MTEHTPGPWEVTRTRLDPWGVNPVYAKLPQDCRITAQGRDELVALLISYRLQPEEVMTANARLIVAAPELLAALERLMSLDSHCDYADEPEPEVCPGDPPEVEDPCHWCQARAAIAKAKGG